MWSAFTRRRHRWLLTLLVLCLPAASPAAEIVLTIADVTVPAGGSADVVVSLSNPGALPVLGIDFALQYNPALLSWSTVLLPCPGVTCGWVLDVHPLADRVTFVAYTTSQVTTSGEVARFRFSNPGASPVTVCGGGISLLTPRVGGPPGDYSVCVATPCGPNPCLPTFALTLAGNDSKLVGQSYSATATLTENGAPKSGATVNFQVTSGPHAGGVLPRTTNGSGIATLTYTGTAPGTDVITANAPVQTGIPAAVPSVPTSVSCVWSSTYSLSLPAPASPRCVGESASIQATFKENNVPKPGITVNFQITSGPNAGAVQPRVTNASGIATLTFTGGANCGTDNITAIVPAQAGVPSSVPVTPLAVSIEWKSFTLVPDPASQSRSLPGSHTVTATFRECGTLEPGVSIEFQILSGPNQGGPHLRLTNASGVATFTYSGTTGGTDQIRVRALAQSGVPCDVPGGTVSCTWTGYSLVLAQSTNSRSLGETHEVTATYTENGTPRSGIEVLFQITSGPNAGGPFSRVTNASGIATYSYPGNTVGTDVITAKAPVQALVPVEVISVPPSVSVVWSGPASRILTLSAPGSIPVGSTLLMTAQITQGGNPITGETVTFQVISGPHQGLSQLIHTNTLGKAVYSGTSTVDGTDRFAVSAPNCTPPSISRDVRWDYRTVIELTPVTSDGPTATTHTITATVRLGPQVQTGVLLQWEILSGPIFTLPFSPQQSDAQGRVTLPFSSPVEGIHLIRCVAPIQAGVPVGAISNTAVRYWGPVPPDMLVGIEENGQQNAGDDFVKFPDLSCGVGVRVGGFGTPFAEVEAIAIQPATNTIFAVDDDRLLTVNPLTGAGTLVGPIGFPNVDGIGFHPTTGVLYGVTHTANKLIRIDPATGAGTLVKASFLVSFRLHDLAFRSDGQCYVLTDRPAIFRIDPTTGTILERWNYPTLRDMEALAWSPDGTTLYTAYERDTLHKDLATLTLVGLDNSTSQFVHPTLYSGFDDIEALAFVPTSIVGPLKWPMAVVPVDAPPPSVTWELSQNWPNPFNPTTRIQVLSPASGDATLAVFDPSGRLVRTLHRGPVTAGVRHFVWDGRDTQGMRVGSGIYFCQLRAPGIERTVRMVMTK